MQAHKLFGYKGFPSIRTFCNICVRVSPFDTVISFFKTIITPELVMMRYKQCHFHHKKFVDMDILKKGDLFSKKIVKQDLETIKKHL